MNLDIPTSDALNKMLAELKVCTLTIAPFADNECLDPEEEKACQKQKDAIDALLSAIVQCVPMGLLKFSSNGINGTIAQVGSTRQCNGTILYYLPSVNRRTLWDWIDMVAIDYFFWN